MIIILYILFVAIIVNCVSVFSEYNTHNTIDIILSIIMVILIVFTLVIYSDIPKALDVYRGKTELKITGEYKDSIFIPKDSTVVFK